MEKAKMLAQQPAFGNLCKLISKTKAEKSATMDAILQFKKPFESFKTPTTTTTHIVRNDDDELGCDIIPSL